MESKVKNFYNTNSKKFDNTRFAIWNSVKEFTKTIPENSVVLDAGCGNGKNMIYLKKNDIEPIGIDFSEKLIAICKSKNLNVIHSNICNLPFRSNKFDFVICIAVIHHLDTDQKRSKAINELLRVCKPGGKILFSVWAHEQEENSRRKFKIGDNLVKFNNSLRYYYIYNKNLFDKFMNSFESKNIFYEMGNWFCIINV